MGPRSGGFLKLGDLGLVKELRGSQASALRGSGKGRCLNVSPPRPELDDPPVRILQTLHRAGGWLR